MKAVIFAEGNGFGHAARSRIISEHLDIPIITFGMGAEYCRRHGMEHIEIPTPYVIGKVREKVRIITNVRGLLQYLRPKATEAMKREFDKADQVIVDGSSFGLALTMLMRKKSVFITNDTVSLVGIQGALQKKAASSLNKELLGYAKAIVVPDFPPPLTASMHNLDMSMPMGFTGPLARPPRQKKHGKRHLVPGNLEGMLRPHLGGDAIYGGDDFSACYKDAEAVFTHAGHSTIMEALSLGKPLICVTSRQHPERYRNALRLQEIGVGVLLDEEQVSARSLQLSIEYTKTLDKGKLDLYRRAAEGSDPMGTLDSIIADAP